MRTSRDLGACTWRKDVALPVGWRTQRRVGRSWWTRRADREEEGEAWGSHTIGALLLTAGHGPGICPNLRPPLLEVAHRASMILKACIICTTSFPEKSSDEIWKHYSIPGLR